MAFAAGLLSFVSPCVLPLIPSYLCVIGGIQMGDLSEKSGKFRPALVIKTLFFVLGFSVIFIALSVVLAASFALMGNAFRWIGWISGAVVIILGLNIIFDFLPFLNYEKRFRLPGAPRGAIGTFLAGAAFGAGWTPCVGPVLAGILLLAAQSGGVPRAVVYLVFFSAGLGLPFVLASAFFDVFAKTKTALRAHLPMIRRVSGALLVIMGVIMITGHYRALSGLAAKWQQSLTNRQNEKSQSVNAADSTVLQASAQADDSEMSDNAVPSSVINAFRNARLPVASRGIDPLDFTLPLLNGETVKLSDLKGTVVFLNFWATWCGPCRAEMPSMEAVYQKLKDRGFEILAVNIMESPETAAAFMNENALTFPTALDAAGGVSARYGIQAIPTSFIIDKRGLIVSRVTGSIDWNTANIIAALESLLLN